MFGSLGANNDVIQNRYSEKRPGIYEAFGQINVLDRRVNAPRGVIVHGHDRGRIVGDRCPKNIPQMHRGAVGSAESRHVSADHLVFRVQGKNMKTLLAHFPQVRASGGQHLPRLTR